MMPGGSTIPRITLTAMPNTTPSRVISVLSPCFFVRLRNRSWPIAEPVTWNSELSVDIAADSSVSENKYRITGGSASRMNIGMIKSGLPPAASIESFP